MRKSIIDWLGYLCLLYGLPLAAVGCAAGRQEGAYLRSGPTVRVDVPKASQSDSVLMRYTKAMAKLEEEKKIRSGIEWALGSEGAKRREAERELARAKQELAAMQEMLQEDDSIKAKLLKKEVEATQLRRELEAVKLELVTNKIREVKAQQQLTKLRIQLATGTSPETADAAE